MLFLTSYDDNGEMLLPMAQSSIVYESLVRVFGRLCDFRLILLGFDVICLVRHLVYVNSSIYVYHMSVNITLTLPEKMVQKIDEDRRDVNRSKYILRLLEKAYEIGKAGGKREKGGAA